jgi:hypothetical protein
MSPPNGARGRGGRGGYQGKSRGATQATKGGNKGNNGHAEQPCQLVFYPPPPGAYGAAHMPQHNYASPLQFPQYNYTQHLAPPHALPNCPTHHNPNMYDNTGQRVVYTEMGYGAQHGAMNGSAPHSQYYDVAQMQWQQGSYPASRASSGGSGHSGGMPKQPRPHGEQYGMSLSQTQDITPTKAIWQFMDRTTSRNPLLSLVNSTML